MGCCFSESSFSIKILFEIRSKQGQRELLNERESSGTLPANRVEDLGRKYEVVNGFSYRLRQHDHGCIEGGAVFLNPLSQTKFY